MKSQTFFAISFLEKFPVYSENFRKNFAINLIFWSMQNFPFHHFQAIVSKSSENFLLKSHSLNCPTVVIKLLKSFKNEPAGHVPSHSGSESHQAEALQTMDQQTH